MARYFDFWQQLLSTFPTNRNRWNCLKLDQIKNTALPFAYEKTGMGPGVILVNGALAYRKFYGERDLPVMCGKISRSVTWQCVVKGVFDFIAATADSVGKFSLAQCVKLLKVKPTMFHPKQLLQCYRIFFACSHSNTWIIKRPMTMEWPNR